MARYYLRTPRGQATPQVPADLTVTLANTQQTMVGFGGTDRNVGQLTDLQAAQFFDPATGIGLSVLVGGIEPNGSPSSFYSNMTKAASYGARIIARPWTAGGARKDNGTDNNGGHLLVSAYGAWSDVLAGYQATIQANAGVNLYALGIQNEPDFTAPYDSMLYSITEMVNFLKVLGPKVKALSPPPLIVLPETADWGNAPAYGAAVLADSTAAPYLDLGGAHQYSGTLQTVATGKPTWQTEYSDLADPYDGSMSEGLLVASKIHAALTVANVTMWAWWILIQQLGATNNEGLTGNSVDSTVIPKRFYVLGHWSKFVRPGAVRVTVTGTVSGVSVTAFSHPTSGALVIVAINTNGGTTTATLQLVGVRSTLLTPYVTDATRNLAAQPAISMASRCTLVLPAASVTSFVGVGA